MATTEMIMVRWAMGVLEHRRNDEFLEEANVDPIAMVMRRRLEWFGPSKEEMKLKTYEQLPK